MAHDSFLASQEGNTCSQMKLILRPHKIKDDSVGNAEDMSLSSPHEE
jgi:hypothetical protein